MIIQAEHYTATQHTVHPPADKAISQLCLNYNCLRLELNSALQCLVWFHQQRFVCSAVTNPKFLYSFGSSEIIKAVIAGGMENSVNEKHPHIFAP